MLKNLDTETAAGPRAPETRHGSSEMVQTCRGRSGLERSGPVWAGPDRLGPFRTGKTSTYASQQGVGLQIGAPVPVPGTRAQDRI